MRPHIFYPGVIARGRATPISLGLGEKLTGYDLSLPPVPRVREVMGRVVWPDGRAAARAGVYLTDYDFPGQSAGCTTATDAQGLFAVRGYEGEKYWVNAVAVSEEQPDVAHAKPRAITLSGDVSGINLVLSEPDWPPHFFSSWKKEEKAR